MFSSNCFPINRVINGGYCIGCGGCATTDEAVSMEFDSYGLLRPIGEFDKNVASSQVCPFATERTEDDIGTKLYQGQGCEHDYRVGYFRGIYAGHVSIDEYRSAGGSSGFVTWLLAELLKTKMIDGVIHAKKGDGALFAYGVSTTVDEVVKGAKSKYYPIHFNRAIRAVRGDGKRYAFVGVPCFVKSIRLICENDEVLAEQIAYCVGLVCGHMKSANYAKFLSGQVGVSEKQLVSIDFRVKSHDAPANRYRFSVESDKQGERRSRSAFVSDLYGTDWGLGYFKPKACDWCDDIVGELADVSSGDAWLPGYVDDPGGNNIIIVRSKTLHHLIEEGRKNKAVCFDDKGVDDVYQSQAGNYRHRREGLAVRIKMADRKAIWHPKKRIETDKYNIPSPRIAIYEQRQNLSASSHEAFVRAEYRPFGFAVRMLPSQLRYYHLNGSLARGAVKVILQLGGLGYRWIINKVTK